MHDTDILALHADNQHRLAVLESTQSTVLERLKWQNWLLYAILILTLSSPWFSRYGLPPLGGVFAWP